MRSRPSLCNNRRETSCVTLERLSLNESFIRYSAIRSPCDADVRPTCWPRHRFLFVLALAVMWGSIPHRFCCQDPTDHVTHHRWQADQIVSYDEKLIATSGQNPADSGPIGFPQLRWNPYCSRREPAALSPRWWRRGCARRGLAVRSFLRM